jgi:small-conductance mechanosensitive channel
VTRARSKFSYAARGSRAAALAALAFALVAGAPNAAHAQQTSKEGKPPSAPPAQPPVPDFIAVSEIFPAAAALDTRIEEIEASLASARIERRVQEQLGLARERMNAALAQMEETLVTSPLLSDLQGLEDSWRTLDDRLVTLGKLIGERSAQLEAWRGELQNDTELWRRTRDEARKADAPESVREEIAKTREEISAALNVVQESRNKALALESQVLQMRRTLAPQLAHVIDAQEAEARRVFVRQRAPLWKSEFSPSELTAPAEALRGRLARMAEELGGYASRNWERLLLLALGAAVFGSVVRPARHALARSRAENVAEDVRGDEARQSLRHPWAIAILAMLLLGGSLPGERPFGLRVVELAIGLPMWALVLRGALPRSLHGAVYGVAGLAALLVVWGLLSDLGLPGRLLLLVQLGAALAGVLWLRRPARLRHLPLGPGQGPWLRLLDLWLRFALVASAVGFVGVVLGFVQLGVRLVDLLVLGSIIGGGYLALVRVLEAVAQLAIASHRLDRLRMVRRYPERVLSWTSRALRMGALAAWLYFLLDRAQLWTPLVEGTSAVLAFGVGRGDVTLSLGGVLAFSLTLYLSWLLSRALHFTLDEEVFPRFRMAPGVPYALATFARYTVLVGGFWLAMAMLGFSADRVTLLLSALGVGIGFGLQNVVNNFVSGAILLFERPVRVGDRIQLQDLLGVVTQIGIRSSRIRTFDGSDVIVPNGDLVASRLVNWTLSDAKRRVIVPVGVAYGSDPRRVLEILERVARGHDEVLEDPAPEILFRTFGTSSLDFELRAWTESPRGFLPVMSDLAVAINDAFREAGIEIPFSQHDLHLRNAPEVAGAVADALRGRAERA